MMHIEQPKPHRRSRSKAVKTHAVARVEPRLFVVFCALTAGFPLLYGGNRDWAWGVMLGLVSMLSIATIWHVPIGARLRSLRWHKHPFVLAAFFGWLALNLWHALPVFLPLPGAHVDAAASLRMLLKTLLYFQCFALTLILVQTQTRLGQLVRLLFYVAVTHAVFASLLRLTGASFVSEFFVFGAGPSMGSYVNRNHFAGYLELHLAMGAGLLLAGLKFSGGEQDLRQKIRDWVKLMLDHKTQLRICMVLLVIALVLTRSRMGNSAFFFALLGTGTLAYFILPNRPPALGALLVSLIVIDLIVVGSWFGADQIAQRLAVTRVALGTPESAVPRSAAVGQPSVEAQAVIVDRERPNVALVAWHMFLKAPLLGHGGGAFRALFPSMRTSSISNKFYDHAHNDFAQMLAEYGLVGAVLIVMMLCALFRAAVGALKTRHEKMAIGMGFAALFGMSALLLHGIADFNLQIPANALLFTVLGAVGWNARYGAQHEHRQKPEAQPRVIIDISALKAN
jgi:O-antigen ligase